MRVRPLILILATGAILASCGSYKQNLLFQVTPAQIEKQTAEAEANYTIQKNDLLTLEVYTNGGERIVDPNRESFKEGGTGISAPEPVQYLVDLNGLAKFPLIDQVRVAGLSLARAEDMLEDAYEKFYAEAFVRLQFTNKRVVVLGAPGGQVIPLANENMRLTEVLALAKGINADARANNIRVLRDEKVFMADLSTFDGYQTSNIIMQPGDIVYVEPVRRPFIEAMRDYSPVITIVTSLATLIFIISQVK